MTVSLRRCRWADNASPEMTRYHDDEWGVPTYADRHLFELLILEGAQAGLAWATILKKRAGYRQAFDDFNAEKVARYSDREIDALLNNPAIVRNRLKVRSAVANARAFLQVQEDFGSFSDYIWQFIGGRPIQNRWRRFEDIPTSTAESDAMARDLKKRGFQFVGTTICYAYMQAVGMVNDHTIDCFRHSQCRARSTDG
jgi:DNA-3-methyladenine glycosylase I